MIFFDKIILGSTVPETLPGTPGDIRAFHVVDESADVLLTALDTEAAELTREHDPNWQKYRNEAYILFRGPRTIRSSNRPRAR
jgi:hypothetical protein